MVGTGRGATAGVLIKNAEALEVLEKVDTLIVDKTGTLTQGKPELGTIVAAGMKDESEILRLAASVERGSEHPLAAAVVAGADAKRIALAPAENVRAITGKGIVGRIEGKTVALGNTALLADLSIDAREWTKKAEELRRAGQTVMFVAVDNALVGL